MSYLLLCIYHANVDDVMEPFWFSQTSKDHQCSLNLGHVSIFRKIVYFEYVTKLNT